MRPLKKGTAERDRKHIIALDIETDGFTGAFIYGAVYDERTLSTTFLSSVSEVVRYLFSAAVRGCVVWSHNGQFDWRYLIEEIKTYHPVSIQPTVQGQSKIIGLTIRTKDKQCIQLKDSYALVPTSLKKFTQTFAPEAQKHELDFDKETFDPTNQRHRDYLRADVEGLCLALRRFDSVIYEAFGVHIHATSASTALAAFKQTIPEDVLYWRLSRATDTFCRNAYYGGRVYLRDIQRHRDCITIDVNAMYASAMRQGVPYGETTYTRTRTSRPGIWRIVATCPDRLVIPLLGARTDSGLVWFRGTTETYATTIEIDKAIELGYTIEYIEGYEWQGLIYPFDSFINKCEGIEVEHKGDPLGEAAKLMRNSLYGKFGTKAEKASYMLADDCPEGYAPAMDETKREPTFIPYLWVKGEETNEPYMHPEWAAWITANARLLLYRYCEAVGTQDVLYTDTDSVTVSANSFRIAVNRSAVSIDKCYGACKLDKEWWSFQALAPKVYNGIDEQGRFISRQKGIPSRLATEALYTGEQEKVEFDSPTSLMSMLKGEQRFGVTRTRKLTNIANSAGWQLEDDGRVTARRLAPPLSA